MDPQRLQASFPAFRKSIVEKDPDFLSFSDAELGSVAATILAELFHVGARTQTAVLRHFVASVMSSAHATRQRTSWLLEASAAAASSSSSSSSSSSFAAANSVDSSDSSVNSSVLFSEYSAAVDHQRSLASGTTGTTANGSSDSSSGLSVASRWPPFHNFAHGVDSLLAVAKLLHPSQCGGEQYLTVAECWGLALASLGHCGKSSQVLRESPSEK
jgi:hypothetical protein